MKKYIAIIASALLLCTSVFIFTGCPSDTAPGTPPTVEETRQVIQGASVGYPPEDVEDEELLTAFSFIVIDLFVILANQLLDIPGWQGSDGTYTYQYSEGDDSFTATLRIVWDAGKGMWHYTLSLDGTIEDVVYNDFTIFEMYAAPDGDQGEITLWIAESPGDYFSVSWDKDDTYITFTMTIQYGEDSFTVTLKETLPYYDDELFLWISERGRLRIDDGDGFEEFSWGEPPVVF